MAPSQKKTRVESSEEVEEAVIESRKKRKIGVGKEVENSGGMPVSAMREEALPPARQGKCLFLS